jgi:hypothetical protein
MAIHEVIGYYYDSHLNLGFIFQCLQLESHK